jgi:hypothetical protein
MKKKQSICDWCKQPFKEGQSSANGYSAREDKWKSGHLDCYLKEYAVPEDYERYSDG